MYDSPIGILVADKMSVAVWEKDNQDPVRVRIASRTPNCLQPFLDWITACSLHAYSRNRRTSSYYLLVCGFQLVAGVLFSACGVRSEWPGSLLLALLGACLTTAGLGLAQVGLFHYCAHYTFFKYRKRNIFLGRLVSSLFFFTDFDAYRAKHMQHHRSNVLLSEEDEFVEFITKNCSLNPGTKKGVLWRRILTTLISPQFHVRFTWLRLTKSNKRTLSPCTLVSIASWTALLGVCESFRAWDVLLIALILPGTILFNASVVLRTMCEHVVPHKSVLNTRGRAFSSEATRAVFAGKAPPTSDAGHWRLVAWWLNMLTVQLFFRGVILVGDAARHDLHHGAPGSPDWVNYIDPSLPNPAPSQVAGTGSTRVWGFLETVDSCLDSISRWDGSTGLEVKAFSSEVNG